MSVNLYFSLILAPTPLFTVNKPPCELVGLVVHKRFKHLYIWYAAGLLGLTARCKALHNISVRLRSQL